MTPLRILLVTRRFWPQADWPETNMARLAIGLQRHGAQVTIVSARWDPNWPAETMFHGMPLIRLRNPDFRTWGSIRYLMALSHWVRRRKPEIDAVCVSRLRFGAYGVLGALRRTNIPVVLRAHVAGAMGDCHWHRHATFGGRILRRCKQADAIVAPDQVTADELRSAGFASKRIHCIANGFPPVHSRGGGDRFDARLALAEANPDLTVANDAAVAVFAGSLRKENGLFALLSAWQIVRTHRPDAKLWLIGDGPLRGEVYQRIIDLDLRQHVFMPGSYEDLHGVLQAANLVVHPEAQANVPQSILEAVAAAVPVVAVVTPRVHPSAILAGPHARIAASPKSPALAQAILDTLDQPPSREALHTARRHLLMEHNLATMARQHLALFQQLSDSL